MILKNNSLNSNLVHTQSKSMHIFHEIKENSSWCWKIVHQIHKSSKIAQKIIICDTNIIHCMAFILPSSNFIHEIKNIKFNIVQKCQN